MGTICSNLLEMWNMIFWLGKYKDDSSIIDLLNDNQIELLKESCIEFDQLVRYADYKIKSRETNEPISDPYSYLKAIAINGGFLKDNEQRN